VVVVLTLHIVFFFNIWSLILVFFNVLGLLMFLVFFFLFLVFWSMVSPRVFLWFLLARGSSARGRSVGFFWARGRSRPLRSRWSRPWWSRPQRRPRPFTAVCTYSALLALLSRFFSFFTSINIFCFQHRAWSTNFGERMCGSAYSARRHRKPQWSSKEYSSAHFAQGLRAWSWPMADSAYITRT
jgi:hypothetical protein